MKSGYKLILIGIASFFLLVPDAKADKNIDNWFSRDKYQHFTISAFYTVGTASVLNRHFEQSQGKSIGIAACFTFSLGLGKEIADKHKKNETSSIKDLIWDAAGVLTGVALAGLLL
jgi:uncharacterized protein YfiM (DUF2279 family)